MREERRRLRYARRIDKKRGKAVNRGMRNGEDRRFGCARGEGRERVAQQPAIGAVFMGMTAVEMDERAELVDVLDRVLQRRLPAGKQREKKKKST